MRTIMIHECGWIRATLQKIKKKKKKNSTKKKSAKPLKPCARGLLETINGLMNLANMSGSKRISETRGLAHNDCYKQIIVLEGILYIKLSDCLPTWNSNAPNYMNNGLLDHKTELVKIINPGLLIKSLINKMCFVSFNGAVRSPFYLENSFTSHYVMPRIWERPSALFEKVLNLSRIACRQWGDLDACV